MEFSREFWVATGIAAVVLAISIAIVLLQMSKTTKRAWWSIAVVFGCLGAVLIFYFGLFDIPTVVVSPASVGFYQVGDTYQFDAHNERSDAAYSIYVFFMISDRDYSPGDFTIDTPMSDRIPLIDKPDLSKIADELQFDCRDHDDHPGLLLVINRMKPNETREITITLAGGVTVPADRISAPGSLMRDTIKVPDTSIRSEVIQYRHTPLPIKVGGRGKCTQCMGIWFKLPGQIFNLLYVSAAISSEVNYVQTKNHPFLLPTVRRVPSKNTRTLSRDETTCDLAT